MSSGRTNPPFVSGLRAPKIDLLYRDYCTFFHFLAQIGSGGLWGSLGKSGGKSGEDLGGFGRLWGVFGEALGGF